MSNKNSINKENYNNPKYLTCKECEYTLTCPRFDGCSFLLEQFHVDDEAHLAYINQIKSVTSPLPYDKFRLGRKSKNTSSDGKEPIYLYHRAQVNDALNILRKGGTAYAYTEQVLKDILKFEGNVNISNQDGIYYIKIINS